MRSFPIAFLFAAGIYGQHNVILDNEQVKVIRAANTPGQKSQMHEHTVNRVMVNLDDGAMTLTRPDGKAQTIRWKAGEALWSPMSGLHMSQNVGGTPYRIIEVELKKKPSGAKMPASDLDPLKVDPMRYKVEFENDQVRVVRAKYAPRDKGVMHEHVLPRVAVFLTPQSMKVTAPDGKTSMLQGEAGNVIMGGAAKHIEENISGQPFEVVVIELKP